MWIWCWGVEILIRFEWYRIKMNYTWSYGDISIWFTPKEYTPDWRSGRLSSTPWTLGCPPPGAARPKRRFSDCGVHPGGCPWDTRHQSDTKSPGSKSHSHTQNYAHDYHDFVGSPRTPLLFSMSFRTFSYLSCLMPFRFHVFPENWTSMKQKWIGACNAGKTAMSMRSLMSGIFSSWCQHVTDWYWLNCKMYIATKIHNVPHLAGQAQWANLSCILMQ